MGRELSFEEVVFEDIIQEISVMVFGDSYSDEDDNYYWPEYKTEIDIVDKVFASGGEDEYLYMTVIFRYKDKFYSILHCESSGGNSGWETYTIKEVVPRNKMIVVYE